MSIELRRTLWDNPPAQRHSKTSCEAAESVKPTAAQRAEVFAHFLKCGGYGSTDEQAQIALRMSGNAQRPRRVELVESGVLVDSGQTRKTLSGRNAVVWKVTESKRKEST